MNVYRAEVFRYGKSFYGRMIMILVIPFAILVAAFLHYVSAGVSSDFLAAAGFSEQTITAIKGQMDGIAYIASAFSASELLVLLMMFPVILHISEDYEQNTIRCELQRSKSRAACYIARVLAAVTYAWGILLEYILISGIAAALFFRNVPEASEAIHEADDLKVYTSGATNMLKYPELMDSATAEKLLGTFEDIEDKEEFVKYVEEVINKDNSDIEIRIGDENSSEDLKDCSLVTATYKMPEGAKGTIGIIGPKRMDYKKVVTMLKNLTDELDDIFNNNE